MGRLNKMSYEEAVKEIKSANVCQKNLKLFRKSKMASSREKAQRYVEETREEINYLLSIIHAHKAARKLYAENLRLRKELDEKK